MATALLNTIQTSSLPTHFSGRAFYLFPIPPPLLLPQIATGQREFPPAAESKGGREGERDSQTDRDRGRDRGRETVCK